MPHQMHQFLNLNKHKLAFAFLAASLITSAFVAAIFAIAYFNGVQAGFDVIVYAFFLFSVALPCFIILISYLAWHYNQWARRKVFSRSPFNQLDHLGLSDSLFNQKKRWHFTEITKAGNINGFALIADGNQRVIEVRAFPAWRQIDKNEYKRLTQEFKAHGIEFEIGSLVKRYSKQQLSFLTIHALKSDLEEFTQLLKRNGFEPQTKLYSA